MLGQPLRGDNAARSVARGLARSESIRPATTQLNSTTQAYQAADTSVPAKEIKTKTKRGATFDEWRRSQQHLAAAAEEVDAREDARRSGGSAARAPHAPRAELPLFADVAPPEARALVFMHAANEHVAQQEWGRSIYDVPVMCLHTPHPMKEVLYGYTIA